MNNNTLDIYPNQATTLEELINCNKMYVHNGVFHMDDVMCCALMISLQEKEKGKTYAYRGKNQIKIYRDRDNIPLDTNAAIMDILGGYFDHHNRDVQNYRDKDPKKGMASMGCLMEVIGERVFGKNYKDIDEKVIMPFDLADLGKANDFVSANLCKLNATNSSNINRCFNRALKYSLDIVKACQNEKVIDRDIKTLIDVPKGISLESMLISKMGEKRAVTFINEMEHKDSPLNFILARMSDEKASIFINDIVLIEERDYLNKKIMDREIKETLSNLGENSDYVIFDYYPGDIDLSDTNVKYIVFPQTGTSSWCISCVTEDIEMKEGFPPSKLRFPTEIGGLNIQNGKPNPIRDDLKISKRIPFKEINTVDSVLKFRLQDTLNTNEEDVSKLRELSIGNEKAMEIITNFDKRANEFENLEDKVALINEFTKRGVEFIHPVGFFAQTESKEAAVKFMEEVLYSDKYEKHRKDWAKEVDRIRKENANDNSTDNGAEL